MVLLDEGGLLLKHTVENHHASLQINFSLEGQGMFRKSYSSYRFFSYGFLHA